jgi:sulfur carrier protein
VLGRFTSDRTLIQVTINGDKRELESPMLISELLTYLEIKTRALAVELNHEIQTREAHGTTQVGDGDVLEIVTLVGGG